jgi:uncharacterized linocin/CFP29 family protein
MPNDNAGRDQVVQWRGTDIWNRIDKAVHDEMARTRVGAKFIPLYGPLPPGTRAISKDEITTSLTGTLSVAEGDDRSLVELSVQFRLTQAQVEDEHRLATAITLATRAANMLARAEDNLIFLGVNIAGGQGTPRIRTTTPIPNVQFQSSHSERGLVPATGGTASTAGTLFAAGDSLVTTVSSTALAAAMAAATQVATAATTAATRANAAANTVATAATGAVAAAVTAATAAAAAAAAIVNDTLKAFNIAYSKLQSRGFYGPFALVLPRKAFADIYQPVGGGLGTPADSIKPLVAAGLFHTGVLPDTLSATDFGIGVLAAVGGNTLDLAIGTDATTAFTQIDQLGQYRFRVYERLALRVKESNAVVALLFANP